MSKRLHQRGEKGALQDWVTVAAPALPEKERNEVLVMLMCSHYFWTAKRKQRRVREQLHQGFIDRQSAAADMPSWARARVRAGRRCEAHRTGR